jgi:hypothetical protein
MWRLRYSTLVPSGNSRFCTYSMYLPGQKKDDDQDDPEDKMSSLHFWVMADRAREITNRMIGRELERRRTSLKPAAR